MEYSVFHEPPIGFQPAIEASGCYCEWDNKILFLKRHPGKPQGNTWAVPGGKLEKHENPREAVIREIREEVGLDIDSNALKMIGKLYCRLPALEYVYNLFRIKFNECPEVDLRVEEHLEMLWVTTEQAMQLPLMAGAAEALKFYQQAKG